MTTEGHAGGRSWLDGTALRSASDVALGGTLVAAGMAAIAKIDGTPFSRWNQLDGWFFPAAVGGLLLMVGIILFIRGCFLRLDQPARWSPLELLIIVATIGAAVLAAWRWGGTLALQFGPSEYARLIAFELAIAIALARASRIRAAGMTLLGLLLATVGTDLSTGNPRLTFGLDELADGISLPVVALGLVVIADGAICLLSPTLFLATYARQVAGWASPQMPTLPGFAMRSVAALAIASACVYAFNLNSSTWDIGTALAFGVFGCACKVFGWNRLVLIPALVYGPLLEENIRRAMLISQGDPKIFLRWPFSGTLLLLACGILAMACLLSIRRALVRRRSPA